VSAALSSSAGRPFGVLRVTRLLERPRSTLYAVRKRHRDEGVPARRRGPKPASTDGELTALIRELLAQSPFVGEGHRKVWARLRHQKGVRTSKARVLRLMREANLLAPTRPQRQLGPRVHDGTILTALPNQMWGTDFTTVRTIDDGVVAVFAAIDHCTAECVGIHAAQKATRFEALEPLRQGLRSHFGDYSSEVALGLQLRHDNGTQYLSDAFQDELAFLGILPSPSFVRAPEGNGCIERFFRTLKEQLLWVRVFRNAEELRRALIDWANLYNQHWLIERHGHRPPALVRQQLLALPLAA
jgi:transposase InsO family protein